MTRRKLAAPIVALVALLCLGVAAFILLWQGQLPIPGVGQTPDAIESPGAPDAVKPQAAVPAPPASETQVTGAPKPPALTAEQPSFDVVRIEPSGEGVVAGQAEPGWQVSIESGGTKVAEATADDQGEWTVVFEKPLSPGDHTLTLKAASPDGTSALSSKQSVAAAIAAPATKQAAGPAAEIQARAHPEAAASPSRPLEQPATTAPAPGAIATASRAETLKPGTASRKVLPPGASASQRSAAGVLASQASRPEAAAARPEVPPSSAAPSGVSALPQTAALEERQVTPDPLAEQNKPKVYTILPGDTLWDIAQRYLGAGWRYPSIFRGNRTIIRNPNLIHPEQQVKMPEEPKR
jgi:nucleoid-associated protein YgaU